MVIGSPPTIGTIIGWHYGSECTVKWYLGNTEPGKRRIQETEFNKLYIFGYLNFKYMHTIKTSEVDEGVVNDIYTQIALFPFEKNDQK